MKENKQQDTKKRKIRWEWIFLAVVIVLTIVMEAIFIINSFKLLKLMSSLKLV